MTITVIDEKPDVRKAEDYFKQAIETSLVNTFPKDSQVQMDFRETGSLPQMTTISGYDAENIYKVMPEETDMSEYSLGFPAVVERAGQELARPARLLPEGGQLALGQIESVIGDWTGNEEIKKSGLLNIQTANRNWQDFIQKFYNEEAVPLTQEQEESLGYKLVNAIGQSVQYVGLGSVNPMLSYLYMAMVVGEESAFNGLQAYIRENPEDTELKGFAEQSGKELLTNAIHVGTELYLEKAVGGFEGVIGAGKTAKTATGSFLKGTAKAFGKGFLSEFPTETLQNLADVGIDWYVGRLNDKEALKGALQAPIEGIIAGIAGGATGTSLFIMNRPSGIAKIDESLTWIPDKQERQATARSIYDNMVETLNDKISVELEQSSQLRTKHGEIYESMKREVANLVKDSGAFADKSESEVASYIESESKRFADNVLAEANKRKVWIDDVIKASDIVEKDGRLYLQGEYFGNHTDKLGPKQKKNVIKKVKEAKPQSLLTFLIRNGGIKDETGELKGMDAIKGRPGLVNNKSGLSLDNAREIAVEAGYFGVVAKNNLGEDITISDLFDLIDRELRGKKVYDSEEAQIKAEESKISEEDAKAEAEYHFEVYFDQRGLNPEEYNDLDFEQKEQLYNELKSQEPKDDSQYEEWEKYVFGDNVPKTEMNKEEEEKLFTLYQQSTDIARENERLDSIYPKYTGETLDINGVEKTVYNSSGERIAQSKEALQNFYKWFGDSKVVDLYGRPIVVYHGTNLQFDTFKMLSAGTTFDFPAGAYFSSNKRLAKGYTNNGIIMPVYLKMENPYVDNAEGKTFNKFYDSMASKMNYASQNGYDGYIVRKIRDSANQKSTITADTYVVFNPTQIKSIDNRGTYSPTEGNIYKQTDVKNLPREKKITRGEFDALTKSIKLYEDANFSTLPHELAHFWLDNIWNYTQSGLASPEYMAQFNDVKKWLGIKDNQRFILPKQHEEFARAYEKYLVNGQYPSEAVKGAFNDYDNWIKSVYNTMRDVDINAGQKKYRPLSRKMFDFFDSMTTGELVAPANLEERTPEENVKYVEKEVEKAKQVIKKDQEQLEENRKHTLMPVQTNTKTGYLTAYEKMTGEKVEAGSIDTKIEFNRAKELVDNNPTLVKDIVEGRAEAPQGYVKNLIYQAYAEQQKKLGNTKERDIAMLNQALELRHYGQEISTQRNQYRNIFEKWASPTFWMLETLKAKQQLLADKSSVKLTDLEKQNKISKATKVGDIIEQQVRKGIKENKSVKQIVNDTVEALGLPTTFKQETVEELYPANYESNITAYNEIYKAVNKALGNSLTEQEVNEITRRADEMLTNLENSMDDDGNPSKDYFIKLKDMENYANSLAPTPLYRVFTDVLGPGNLMASVKTFLKNIVGNLPTFGLKFAVRRAIIGQNVSIVDKELINDYKKRSFDIFNATGYNISSMEINSQKDISYGAKILGEDITHAQGKTYGTGLEQAPISEKVKYLLTGEYKNLEKATPKERFDYAIRGWARLYEDWVYKWGLGSLHFNKMTMKDGSKEPAIKLGDIFFKDFAFTDHVALEASKEANGDVAKANAIFKDATRIIPETELGQEIRQRAVADALISTYQNRGKSAEGALKARKIIDIIPGAGKFAITFAMTPANLIAMGLETSFSPVIIAYDAVAETLRDKKISRTLKNKESLKKIWAFDKETTSKMKGLITQSGVAGFISLLLAYGLFDDDDYMPDYALATPKERELARELNIPYNSIRIGDTWVSLDYLGPLGSMFSGIMAAKRAETIGEWLTEYSREAGIQAFSLPAFEGFDKILEIGKRFIKGTPEETIDYTIETFTNAMYSRSMPTIISDITKAFDPYERETEKSGFKKMMLRTPGLRTKLDERVNVTTGMPEKRAQNDIKRVLLDVLTGAGMKEQVVNPIADELLRLAQKDEGVSLTGITYRGDLSKVLPEYKQKVREDFAKLYSKRVGALIKTDGYKRKTDEEKKESINAIRRAIVKELKGKYKGYIKK